MRYLLAAALLALLLAPSAFAGRAPIISVMEDGGGQGTTCRWNPWASFQCNLTACWWVGRFEWYDPYGNSTGIPCA